MTTDTKTFRRLDRTIANPVYDRRCKHGLEGIVEFEAGEPFIHVASEFPWGVRDDVHTISDRYISDPRVVEALLAASSESAPRTWREDALATDALLIARDYASDIIDVLVARGFVNIADVAAAIASIRARWDAEEAA